MDTARRKIFIGRAKSIFPMGNDGLDVMIEKAQGKGQKVSMVATLARYGLSGDYLIFYLVEPC